MEPIDFILHDLAKRGDAAGFAVVACAGPVAVTREDRDLTRPGADFCLVGPGLHRRARLVFRGPALSNGQPRGFILADQADQPLLLSDRCAAESLPDHVLMGSRQEGWYGFAADMACAVEPAPCAVRDLTPTTRLAIASGNRAALARVVRREVCPLFHEPVLAAPVRIAPDALGPGQPDQGLVLSPDQAVLVEDVFVRAGVLVGAPGVTREPFDRVVTYFRPELTEEACLTVHGMVVPARRAAVMADDRPEAWEAPEATETPEVTTAPPRPAMLDLPMVYSVRQLPFILRTKLGI